MQTIDDSETSDFDYNDNIGAAYLQLTENYKNLVLKAGVRYEYTDQNADYIKGAGTDFSTTYGTAVPNASLTYRIGQTSNVNFSYSMRISRPGINQLNPYLNKSNPLSWSYGNADLDPQKYHNFTLGYGRFGMKHNLNLTLSYSTSHTGITDYTFYDGDILNTTYTNATENNNLSLNIYYGYNMSQNTRFMISGTLNYIDISNPKTDESNSGFQGNMYVSVNQTLWKKIKGSLGVFAMSRQNTIRGYQDGFTFGNLSFSRDFCNDKLTLALTAAAPLKTFNKLDISAHTETTENINDLHIEVPVSRIELSLQWRFGKQGIGVKHANTSVERIGSETNKSSVPSM